MNSRMRNVCCRMEKAGLTQLLVTDPWSIYYLTGKLFQPGERFLGLLLKESGDHRIFINRLFPAPGELGAEKVWFSDTDECMAVVAGYVDPGKALGIDKMMPARFLLELMERKAAGGYRNGSFCVDDTPHKCGGRGRLRRQPAKFQFVWLHSADSQNIPLPQKGTPR